MLFDPNLKKGELMWKVYPSLSKRDCFCKLGEDEKDKGFNSGSLNKMLKFVVLFVDPASPYGAEKDFDTRLDKCRVHLHLRPGDKLFKEILEGGEWWQRLVFEYFKMINGHLYEKWFTTKTSYHLTSMELRSPDTKAVDRVRLQKILDEIYDSLVKIENLVFPDEMTKRLINMKATETVLTGYAERFAIRK